MYSTNTCFCNSAFIVGQTQNCLACGGAGFFDSAGTSSLQNQLAT